MNFSAQELERYARHIVLREVGGAGQARLKASRILVVGAGGLGCPALLYLAAAGVGRLRFIDDDSVSLSNLQRQILYQTDHIGNPKVFAAAETLKALNPEIALEPLNTRLSETNTDPLEDIDLVLDGSDSFETRQLVNKLCVQRQIPLVSAAISQWEGQLGLFDPAQGGPCYACVFPQAPADGLAPDCAEAGVLGALAGIMGSMMAAAALRYLTNAGRNDRGTLLIYDAAYPDLRKIKIHPRKGCQICQS